MKDLIIGCLQSYSEYHVRNWTNSIILSGFKGDKVAIVYGSCEAREFLESWGFEIIDRPETNRLVVDRFKDLSELCASRSYRFVYSLDVGDVVFQEDPTKFVEERLQGDKEILVGSEALRYRDEDWANWNITASYPQFSEFMLDKTIYNAGTIVCKGSIASEFFGKIYSLSIQSRVGNPDQAAMNVLIQTEFKDRTYFSSMEDGWCCQCGTVVHSNVVEPKRDKFLEPLPIIRGHLSFNSSGKKFQLLHQYTRVRGLINEVFERYYHPFIFVTALYDIGRNDGRTWDQYLFWFENTLKLKVPMVIYGEETMRDWVLKRRDPSLWTKFVECPFESIPMMKYLPRVQEIIGSETYKKKVSQPWRLECHLARYPILNYNKLNWLLDASERFGTEGTMVLWFDAGASRFIDVNKPIDPMKIVEISNRYYIQTINYPDPDPPMNLDFFWLARPTFMGSFMGGRTSMVRKVNEEMIKILEWILSEGIVATEECSIGFVSSLHPEWFFIKREPQGRWLSGFDGFQA